MEPGTSSEHPDRQQSQYLTFVVGDTEYGIGILRAKEIIEYDTVTAVPNAPPFVRGVINLRGRVVSVVDLAVRFGRQPADVTRRSCIVVVEIDRGGTRDDKRFVLLLDTDRMLSDWDGSAELAAQLEAANAEMAVT